MIARTTLGEAVRLLADEADRPTRWRLVSALVIIASASAIAATAPLALKDLVDALSTSVPPRHAELPGAWRAGALYLLALCVARALTEVRPWVTGTTEQLLAGRVRLRYFKHLLALPLGFHLQRHTGASVQTVNQAATGFQLLTITLMSTVAPVLIELACICAVLYSLDQPALVACFGLTALAYLFVFASGAKRLRDRSSAVIKSSLLSHGLLADHLLNCEAVKCCNAEAGAHTRLAVAVHREHSSWSSLYRQRAVMGLGATAVFSLSVAASLMLAGNAVAAGTLSLGGFVLANVYILQIVRPLEALGSGGRDLLQAAEWIRPLLDVLQLPAEGPQRPGATTALDGPAVARLSQRDHADKTAHRASAPFLSLRRVSFAYDAGQPVLDGIDLDVAAGRTVAVVGRSGSGKSSLIRLLLRLHDPQQGHILINGVPIAAKHPAEVRRLMGFVPQDTTLLHDTIAANIALGDAHAPPEAIEHAARLAGLSDLIASLPGGYDTLVGERGLKLSGGERQRVAIARAVLRRPRLFLFDEATSMLDSATEAAVMRNIRQAARGCTSIIVAHRLSTVSHADEIVVLDRGTIAERGSHAALLLAGGLYARMWQLQHPRPSCNPALHPSPAT